MSSELDTLVKHYESKFAEHGDNCKGVDWPNEEDAATRYRIMSGVIKPGGAGSSILDYGCGLAGLADWYKNVGLKLHPYTGYDPSEKMIEACRAKYPDEVFTHDWEMLDGTEHDYVIMNGLFTLKSTLTDLDMCNLMHDTLTKVWPLAKVGIAFNVMSADVDKKRDDLFHLNMGDLSAYLCKNFTRNFVIRNDYGLYEYTTYLYK